MKHHTRHRHYHLIHPHYHHHCIHQEVITYLLGGRKVAVNVTTSMPMKIRSISIGQNKMLRFKVKQHGGNDNGKINWKELSMSQSFHKTRSIIQCKNRWYNHLQPHIKKGIGTRRKTNISSIWYYKLSDLRIGVK
mmetsp:Transcript_42663/g.43415  ORF Transcript_42663/g.43415 Transcript_42663/m.43415 type:complete len:135 (-) Transcript_42663:1137-1541(-)